MNRRNLKKRSLSLPVKEASTEVIRPYDLAYRLPQPGIRSCHRCSPVYHAPRTHARMHARTHAKKTGEDSLKGSPCVYLAFPQFSTRLLLSRLTPAFADGQTEAIANFKDSRSGCFEWYRQCILSRCLPSRSRRVLVLGSACTQSRGLGQHSNGSAFIVEDRRSEQSVPRRCS